MPNWCSNNAEFHNDDVAEVDKLEAHLKFLDENKSNDNIESGLFGHFVPRPSDQEDNWYDWNINNWGTKWDISPYGVEINEHGVLVGAFDSPWGPPIQAYEKLEALGFEVRAYYYEPGMGFTGMYEGADEYYDYSGMSADEAEDMLPETLNEMYGITENMREWEEENEEE